MNRSIPIGGGPRTSYGREIAARLPALVARLRGPEIDALAANLEHLQLDALTRTAQDILGARHEAISERQQLQSALELAPDAKSTRRTLEHHLRRTGRGRQVWKDLRALRRWLDAEAIFERLDSAIDTQGVYLELLALMMIGETLNGQADRFLRQMLSDSRIPTRRAAATALARSLETESTEDEEVRNQRAELLIQHILEPQEDIITARRCLDVLLSIPNERARELIDTLFGEFSRRDDFLLRAQAARLGQRGSIDLANHILDLARNDASETVRSALAEGLSSRHDPDATTALLALSRVDTARSVRVRARQLLLERADPDVRLLDPNYRYRFRPDPAIEDLADRLGELRPGSSRKVQLPGGTTVLDLARALVYAADSGHGFSLAPTSTRHVRVTRGERSVLRLWRLIHELRNPTPDKRHLGDHLSGRGHGGPIRVPPERLGAASDTVPSARVRNEQLDSWAPWLPRPEDCLDASDWGSLVFITVQGVTTVTAPRQISARLRSQLHATWAMPQLSEKRESSLSATGPQGRGAYSRQLSSMGYLLEFETHSDGGVPLPQIEQYFPSVLSPLALLLSTHRNTPADLALATGIVAAGYFGRLAWHHHKIRHNRAVIPLVIGGWGTRGKTGTERLKAAVFEGLGYPIMCKTTGSEPSLLMNRPGGVSQVLRVFRPLGKASIWEQATLLEQAAQLRPRVLLWECMALRDEYVDQLQHEWTRDDISTITNAHPDHEDVQGPGAADVAKVISRFIPNNSPVLTTEVEMLPILRDSAKQKRALLRAVDKSAVHAIGKDMLERLPYDEHPENLALVAAMAVELGIDSEEALILMGDHVVSDLGSLATSDPVRHLGRFVRFTNAMSANHKAGFLASWRRSGVTSADPQGRPSQYVVTVVNNRRDRVARSKAFASLLVNEVRAHRHVLMGTNVQGLVRYLESALDEHLDQLVLSDDARGLQRGLSQLRRQLCIVSPSALIRSTARSLGLTPETVIRVTKTLDATLSHPPAELLSLQQARALLEHLLVDLEELAETARGSLFHDDLDRRDTVVCLAEHWLASAAESLAFAALGQFCTHEEDQESRNRAGRILAREIFLSHVCIIDNSEPLGEQVTRFVLETCPPGVHIQAMGIQNIGGAGLAFARDWAHGAQLSRWTQQLDDETERDSALEHLAHAKMGGLPFFQEALRAVQGLNSPDSDLSEIAEANLELQVADRRAAVVLGHLPTSLATRVFQALKIPFQPLAAIRGRRRSEQLMSDLAQERISLRQAALQLADLESRSPHEPVTPLERGGLI